MKRQAILAGFLFAASIVGHADSSARLIHYHTNDIVALKAKMRYTTMIELPAGEKILEATTGDRDFWIIEAVQNYCFLHPAKDGIHSNLNLITDKGNVYSFTLDAIEDGEPDLKVLIEPSDPAMVEAIQKAPRFVPTTDIEPLRMLTQSAQQAAGQQVERFRSEYPIRALKFDYQYRSKKPFEITAIYHDDQFTYIKSRASEKFALYELKDGKPSFINYELREGTYVIPKVLDRGYLQIGKKHMTFERKPQ